MSIIPIRVRIRIPSNLCLSAHPLNQPRPHEHENRYSHTQRNEEHRLPKFVVPILAPVSAPHRAFEVVVRPKVAVSLLLRVASLSRPLFKKSVWL